MNDMAIVIFHGSFNSLQQISDFWLPEITRLKQKVIFPQFPVDTWEEVTQNGENAMPVRQTLDAWLKKFEEYVPEIRQEKELVFVGHSSGPLFILSTLQKYQILLKSAVFVSPFLNPLTKPAWQVKEVNKSFYANFDFDKLQELCPKSYSLYGIDDPYVETENTLVFADKMKSILVPIEYGGHLNNDKSGKFVTEYCRKALID